MTPKLNKIYDTFSPRMLYTFFKMLLFIIFFFCPELVKCGGGCTSESNIPHLPPLPPPLSSRHPCRGVDRAEKGYPASMGQPAIWVYKGLESGVHSLHSNESSNDDAVEPVTSPNRLCKQPTPPVRPCHQCGHLPPRS